MNPMSVPDRLAKNLFVTDDEAPHIEIDNSVADKSGLYRAVAVCPARVYSVAADGDVEADPAACLECGACLAVCPPGNGLTWFYPRGGFGVQYREG